MYFWYLTIRSSISGSAECIDNEKQPVEPSIFGVVQRVTFFLTKLGIRTGQSIGAAYLVVMIHIVPNPELNRA